MRRRYIYERCQFQSRSGGAGNGGAPLDPGTVIAVAVEGLAVAGDGVPVVDVSKKHGVLHMADPAEQIGTPGAPATVGAPTVSMFQTNSCALRCIARITWAAAPGSVAVVTGTTW